MLRSPFAWIGGKSKLADDIVGLFPEHRLYVEVFGGALSVLYRKPKTSGRRAEIVNDINGDLINLHQMIRDRPESLSMYLHRMIISRDLFYGILHGKIRPVNDIERAAFFYYLITQSFGSKGRTFAMAAKTRRPKDIYRSFAKWSQRLRFVTIENMSFEKLVTTYDKPDAFFYCDPPYVGTEHYYTSGFTVHQHKQLAEVLHGISGKFLLSYNDCDLVRDLYADLTIVSSGDVSYTLRGGHHQKKVREVFIRNY